MEEQQITCRLCEDVFDEENEGVATKCGHVFHSKCLNIWLIDSSACPQCTKKVKKADNIKLNFKFAYSSDDCSVEELKKQLKKQDAKMKAQDDKIQELKIAVSVCELIELKKQCEVGSESDVTLMRDETEKLSQEIMQLKQEIKHLKNAKGKCLLNERQKDPKTATKASKKLLLNHTTSAEDQHEEDSVSQAASSGQSCITRRRMKKMKLSKK